jgi:hypothetical protein
LMRLARAISSASRFDAASFFAMVPPSPPSHWRVARGKHIDGGRCATAGRPAPRLWGCYRGVRARASAYPDITRPEETLDTTADARASRTRATRFPKRSTRRCRSASSPLCKGMLRRMQPSSHIGQSPSQAAAQPSGIGEPAASVQLSFGWRRIGRHGSIGW